MKEKKKTYVKESNQETNALRKRVVEHGEGKWQKIKTSNPILEKKDRLQLKDKFRNLKNLGKHLFQENS